MIETIATCDRCECKETKKENTYASNSSGEISIKKSSFRIGSEVVSVDLCATCFDLTGIRLGKLAFNFRNFVTGSRRGYIDPEAVELEKELCDEKECVDLEDKDLTEEG